MGHRWLAPTSGIDRKHSLQLHFPPAFIRAEGPRSFIAPESASHSPNQHTRSIFLGGRNILCYNAATMRQTNSRLIAEQKPLGVIDVLTAGFETVRKRP